MNSSIQNNHPTGMSYDLSWLTNTNRHDLPDHVDPSAQEFQKLKTTLHQHLVETLDVSQIDLIDRDELQRQVRSMAGRLSDQRGSGLNEADRQRMAEELMAEIFGLGPLEPLMRDPDVSDILVNDPYTVYVERHGVLELTNVVFADDAHLVRIIQRIVANLGRRIDEVSPMVDARLPDGSRVNAVIPPLALDGPSMSIRRFGSRPLQMPDLLDNGSCIPEIDQFLQAAVRARVGCVISGGTGAGKTTFLNALSASIPAGERLVTIEDSAELILQHRHRVRMETRPANPEGAGEITQRELVRNALRMRPDRIIVGEVRGAEVWDMLQAMSTGHEGSLTTVHANSSRDALARLEMMVALSGIEVPISIVRGYISLGINLVVHLARLAGGPRRVVQVLEVVAAEGDRFETQEIFGFQQQGVSEKGVAFGRFYATGNRPACLDRLEAAGQRLPDDLFTKRVLD